jgi:hypothetical protein
VEGEREMGMSVREMQTVMMVNFAMGKRFVWMEPVSRVLILVLVKSVMKIQIHVNQLLP